MMRRFAPLIFGGAFVLLGGCRTYERPVIIETEREPTVEVRAPVGHAIETIRAYDYEQQNLVVGSLQSVLADLDQRISDLRGRSKSIASDQRDRWSDELTELEKTRDQLEVLVSRVKFATRDDWEEVKSEVLDKLEDVQDHLDELQSIAGE